MHDLVAAAPTPALLDLLVGKHRLIVLTPIDHGAFSVDESFFKKFDEKFLLPARIKRIGGSEHATSRKAKAKAVQLIFHIINIFVSPSFRVNAVFDRRIFRRHAEAVKADRLKHIVSA